MLPYNWIKAFHVIMVISWMAGMLYLPRLYVYHADARIGSELSDTLKVMERRLLRFIINPAMILAYISGLMMVAREPGLLGERFFQVKLVAVLLLTVVHALLARYRRAFVQDRNIHSAKFFRFLNEVPTLLMIIIIVMVFVHPWA